jgi:putative transposase
LSKKQRKAMIEPSQQPSISRQCEILGIRRSSYYYRPKPIKPDDLDLMRQIDEMYLQDPTLGSRSISRQLKRQVSILKKNCTNFTELKVYHPAFSD